MQFSDETRQVIRRRLMENFGSPILFADEVFEDFIKEAENCKARPLVFGHVVSYKGNHLFVEVIDKRRVVLDEDFSVFMTWCSSDNNLVVKRGKRTIWFRKDPYTSKWLVFEQVTIGFEPDFNEDDV